MNFVVRDANVPAYRFTRIAVGFLLLPRDNLQLFLKCSLILVAAEGAGSFLEAVNLLACCILSRFEFGMLRNVSVSHPQRATTYRFD